MLKDLTNLKTEIVEKISAYSGNELVLPTDFQELFRDNLSDGEEIEYLAHSSIYTYNNKKVYFPNQWFYLASIVAPYTYEVLKYKRKLLSLLPNDKSKKIIIDSKNGSVNELAKLLNQNNIPADEQTKLINFASKYDSWNGAKEISRGDFYISPTLSLLNLTAASSEFLAGSIVKRYIASDSLFKKATELLNVTLEEKNVSYSELDLSTFLTGGINKIYYGAPGTGKSWKVNQDYPDYDRITFHPEYSYFDFIGGIKPNKEANFEFIPGPFSEALKDAFNTPDKKVGLIVEEVNRANTAAVFGDIFQLLDRDDNGKSEYTIKHNELKEYLQKTTHKKIDQIFIPSNFSLIATMNSSDQGVFVLDSAFKRRWEFEYMPIDFNSCSYKDKVIVGFDITWEQFSIELNAFLINNDIPEDKLIGPFFLKESDLSNKNKISSKLLSYLWDDVVRYNRESLFTEKGQFSKVINAYMNNQNIFVSDLTNSLNSHLSTTTDAEV